MKIDTSSKFVSEQLKHKSTAIIKINGHDVMMKDYMADPQKYNSLPFKEISAEQVQLECETNLETKKQYVNILPPHINYYRES